MLPHELTHGDHAMFQVAANRQTVVLESGQQATLIAWKPTRKRGGRGGRWRDHAHCRVEYPNGRRRTVSITEIAEVLQMTEPPRQGAAAHPLDRWERRGGLYSPGRQRMIVLTFDSHETALAWDALSDEQIGRLLADITSKALND